MLSSGGNDVNIAPQNVANQQMRSPNEMAGGASGPGGVEPPGAVDQNTNIQQQPNIKQRQQLGMNQPQEQCPPPSMQGTPPLDPISEPRPTQGDEPGCSSVITSILKKRESENSLRGKPAKVRKTTKSSAPAYAITLGVVSRDDNKPHFTLEEGDILREAIIDYVVQAFDQELRPSFYDILNREGFLIVQAQHENSAKWLLKHAEGIGATCNLPFKVVEGDDIPNSCLMHGFFPKAHKIEDDTILTFLEAQNYDLPARRWKIVKKIPSNEGATCTISMDLRSVAQVKKENFILCYRAGHVRLQPINPVGMLVEEPVSHIAGISPNTGSKPKRARRAPKKSKLIETSVLKHLDPITADGKGKPKEEGVTNGDNKANPKLGNLSPGPSSIVKEEMVDGGSQSGSQEGEFSAEDFHLPYQTYEQLFKFDN